MAWPDLDRSPTALRAFLEHANRRDVAHAPRTVDHYVSVIVRAGDALGDPPWRARAVLRYLLFLRRVYAPRYLLLIAHVLRLYHRERRMPICDSYALCRWRAALLAQQRARRAAPLGRDHLSRLLKAAYAQPAPRGARNEVLLRLALDTGWHVAQVLRLRWSELVAVANGGWHLIAEDRRIALSPSTSDAITRWREFNLTEHVVCGIRQGRLHQRPLNINSAVKLLKQLFRAAGLRTHNVSLRLRRTTRKGGR